MSYDLDLPSFGLEHKVVANGKNFGAILHSERTGTLLYNWQFVERI